MDEAFRALADPNRRRLLDRLGGAAAGPVDQRVIRASRR